MDIVGTGCVASGKRVRRLGFGTFLVGPTRTRLCSSPCMVSPGHKACIMPGASGFGPESSEKGMRLIVEESPSGEINGTMVSWDRPPMRLWVKGKLQALTRCVHLSRGKVITSMCGYVMSMSSIGRLTMVGVGGIVDRWLVLMVNRRMRGRLEICCVGLENLIL